MSDWAIAADGKVDLSPMQVFQAWTDAALMQRWMAPGTMRVNALTVDPVENGLWRIEMQDVEGVLQVAHGHYVSLLSDRELELTWQWEGQHYDTTIVVSIEPDLNGGTNVCIEQKGFPSMDVAQSHESGWSYCLEKLAKLASVLD
ncbi:hypothetical protein A9Q99_12000 [Gammaproteobacteria bacterium 45_16_T64]|nr:hypothetical protein A9Q99_12000 [Gammaproteobacteria bacterium 45_16_T64]